ncbi:tetratricopeptide repeat protein [Parapedobacter sp. DT-150]|uniref:tetratricopeptide repeat protein n=1 Tax=Parapedobacter sp. DT-150 TaxID=3396162 RepID=UPI003F1D2BBE
MNKVFYIAVLACCWLSIVVGYAQNRQPDNNRLLEFYQSQQYREAAEYLKQYYPDTIADPTVLSRLGYCYRMAGDYGQATRYYLQLYALDSTNTSTLSNLAAIHIRRGQYLPAAGYYQRIIAVDSAHVAAYDALSGLMRRRGELDSAYHYLRRANQIQPVNSDIAYDFAQLCMDLERHPEADTVLQRALQADPEHGLLLLGKIKVAEKLENYLEVVNVGERLVEQGDESQQVLSILAKGYFHIDDFIGCQQTYERLLAIYEQMGEIDYYYLAMAYKTLKRYKDGLECMDKVLALAISPNAAFYYGRKADLHDLANQPSAAASSYLRSFQFEVIPLHYYSLAVLYDRKLSDTRNALRYYRLYLKQQLPQEERVYVDYAHKRIDEIAPE